VEASDVPVARTLAELGVPRSTFYRWYARYRAAGADGLAERRPGPRQFWNRIPEGVRQQVVAVALERPDQSPRQLAWHLTDNEGYFISETSVYRILRSFALWPKPKRDKCDGTFIKQLRLFVTLLRAMLVWFDHIVFVSGNHDRRLGIHTKGEFTLDDILAVMEIGKAAGKIMDVTEYNYVYKDAPEHLKGTERYVPWLMAHPMKGSGGKMAGGLGQKLYEVERLSASLRQRYGDIKPHIVEPHTHKWGVTLTTDAARQILAIGCSRDPERTRYKQDKSTYSNWVCGFGMVDDEGYDPAWNLEHTNWRRVLHLRSGTGRGNGLHITSHNLTSMAKTSGDVNPAGGHRQMGPLRGVASCAGMSHPCSHCLS
jgi:transposase